MDDAVDLSRAQKIQALAGVLLAMFLAALDQTVVATAGPDMQRALNMDASLYTWITTAYLVSSTVLVPVYGKLSDLFGRRRIVVFGVVLFLLGSLLCGLSQSSAQLIAFRAVQGAGSASLFTSAFAVVADLFPPSERGKYTGLFGGVFGVSSLIGPLLGGFITDAFGWHWVFFINLPLGAVALTFILLRMPPLQPRLAKRPRIDGFGAVLLALGVVPLLIGLTLGRPEVHEGELGYLWSDWQVLSLFAVAAVGLLGFTWWELRVAEPLVDLRLFGNRTVLYGIATVFVLGGAFLTPMVFLPLFMVNVVGVSATQSGLTISPLVLGLVAGNVLSGQLVSRFGRYKPLMVGSLVLLLVGFVVMAFTLSSASTQAEVTAKMVLLGLGLGPTVPLYTIAIQNAVEPAKLGVSTSMVTFFRQMGSTVGIAVVGSLFAATLSGELKARVNAATVGLPTELVARFAAGGPGAEGGAPVRFEPAAVKARVEDQLEGALRLATRALEGEALAGQLVAGSALASPSLKAAVEAGGVGPAVRARYTVTRSKLRRAAQSDEVWAALRTEAPEGALPEARPTDERALTALDASLEEAGARAAEAALGAAVAEVKAEIDAQRPRLFAAVDAVGAALREAFTAAILGVYRVALVLVVLALLLTLRLPQLPLRTGAPPTVLAAE